MLRKVFRMNGTRYCSSISVYNGASIIPSKIQTPVAPAATYPTPDMHFHRVLWSRFVSRFLPFLVAVIMAVGFHLHASFVCPYNILELVSNVSPSPFQTFGPVRLPNQLAVRHSTPGSP